MQDRDHRGVARAVQLCNIQAFDVGIAAPKRLRIHDIVKVQNSNQLKHGADVALIHACERLIQSQKQGRVGAALLILGGNRREEGNIHGHGLFSAAEFVKSAVRQLFSRLPIPFIQQMKFIPGPIIQHVPDQIRVTDHLTLKRRILPGLLDLRAKMHGYALAILPGQKRPVLIQQPN